uniref:Uncharacterized protein n=1 Tax=Meloidogyne enterolobii TaxID=390850 RepID=A0A6V7VME8_MELEN|nr:unnamed protein product [Meloidogyne enterolobii]
MDIKLQYTPHNNQNILNTSFFLYFAHSSFNFLSNFLFPFVLIFRPWHYLKGFFVFSPLLSASRFFSFFPRPL